MSRLFDALRTRLWHPTTIALAVKVAGAAASFVITFIIARLYGAAVSGDYAFGLQTGLTVSTFALLGLDQVTTRTIGGDLREGRKDLARAAIQQAGRFIIGSSALAAVLLIVLSPLAERVGSRPSIVLMAIVVVAAMPLLQVAVSGLRAAGLVVFSQFVFGPAQSAILAVALLAAALGHVSLNGEGILLLYGMSLGAACLLAWVILLRLVRRWPSGGAARHDSLARIGWPIVFTTGIHMLSAWVLMAQISSYAGVEEVGAYRVAMQILTIITLLVTTVEGLVAPQFAGDFRVGDYAGARARHRRASLMLALATGPLVLLCVAFPARLLALFGPEFVVAATALQITAGAQVFNILTGPVGAMLLMAGGERLSLIFAIASFVIATAVAALLAPAYGLTGAAVGFAAGLIFRNIATYIAVTRRMGAQAQLSRPAESL